MCKKIARCATLAWLLLATVLTTLRAEQEDAPEFEVAPHTLNITTHRVVVHTSSAVVFSHGALKLDAGPHLILLRNLSTLRSWNGSLEETSLQVDLEGGGALVERMVWADVPLATKEELKTLTDEIDRIELERRRLSEKVALSDSYLRTLSDFGQNLISPSPELVQKGESIVKILKDAHEARVDVDEQIYAMKNRRAVMDTKLKKLRENLQQSSMPQRVAKLYISVEKSDVVRFRLQRIVASVTWRPHYEVHINSTTGLVTLMYHALVHQESGHPWSDVSMELCTGAPSTDRSVPSLSPWFIRSNSGADRHFAHNSKNHYKMASNSEIREMKRKNGRKAVSFDTTQESSERSFPHSSAYMDIAEDQEEDDGPGGSSFELSEVISSGVSDVFLLPKRQTIPSSQDIRVHITTITLTANLTYTAVPKRSTKIYVQAEVINDSRFTLLAGSSLVFVDGSFVGSSSVNLIPTNGRAFLDAGIDNALSVVKKLISDETKSSGGVFARTNTKELKFELVLKSMRSFPVTVRVKDQVPLPQSEDLKVHVYEPSLGDLRADHKQARIDSNTTLRTGGEVVWERHLAPDSVLKIPLHFTIEVDAERHIVNLEL